MNAESMDTDNHWACVLDPAHSRQCAHHFSREEEERLTVRTQPSNVAQHLSRKPEPGERLQRRASAQRRERVLEVTAAALRNPKAEKEIMAACAS